MNNNQKAEYIFQQLVERGAALPHVAVLCIETALNDLDIAAQPSVRADVAPQWRCKCGWANFENVKLCSACGTQTVGHISW